MYFSRTQVLPVKTSPLSVPWFLPTMSPLFLLSFTSLPAICLTLWSVAGEEKEELLPLLYCQCSVQVMSLIYSIMLLGVRIPKFCSISFYTLSMAGLVWMSPYLMGASCSLLLLATTSVEVMLMMGKVIFVAKEQEDECEDKEDEDEGRLDQGGGAEGRVPECGMYTVREEETVGGKTREDWWGSGDTLVI
eukprot:GFUD01022895.1.p1 GENE.GFUD01022895.1~~GFUD01022895.1.p1  ORF type:complete len:191 (-),score=65.59 GFUD01022895.1:145-717(-)